MKGRMIFIALMFCATAQAQQQELGDLRANDPFVFCRYGQKIKDPCWIPIAPYTGQWVYTWLCDEPNEDARSWTGEDREALRLYMVVCREAKDSGTWDGRNGSPESSPFEH